jgi:hypothetical protein
MAGHLSPGQAMADDIIERIERLIEDAERTVRPLEIEPYRSQLFELFVLAEATGFIADDSDPDLTADGIGRELAQRWNLADATRESFAQHTQMPPEHLSKMRMLWSFMRMWMEWTYAWQRWPEFHSPGGGVEG